MAREQQCLCIPWAIVKMEPMTRNTISRRFRKASLANQSHRAPRPCRLWQSLQGSGANTNMIPSIREMPCLTSHPPPHPPPNPRHCRRQRLAACGQQQPPSSPPPPSPPAIAQLMQQHSANKNRSTFESSRGNIFPDAALNWCFDPRTPTDSHACSTNESKAAGQSYRSINYGDTAGDVQGGATRRSTYAPALNFPASSSTNTLPLPYPLPA